MASKAAPRVSILLPTHNRADVVGRAIQSVLDQTFGAWELIVVDDASTDTTPEVLAAWRRKEPRLRVLRATVHNFPDISEILNWGLREARGKYIARIDDDDYWCDPRKLEKQIAFLETHPDYVVVGGGVIVVNDHGEESFRYLKSETDGTIRSRALFANPFSHTTVLFKRKEALETGGYGTWRYAEDWELWLRMGEKGKLYNFRDYFTVYRLADQNKSLLFQRDQAKMTLRMIALHRRAYPHFAFAFLLNALQYLYSLVPHALRKNIHPFLVKVKRTFF